MLKKLISTGIEGIEDVELKEKVITTNQIALCLTVLATLYTCIAMYFDTFLGSVYLFSTVLIVISIFLNSLTHYNASRFLLNLVGIGLIFYSNLMLTKTGEAPNAGGILAQLGFAIIPLIIISTSEKWLLSICLAINITSFFLIRPGAGWYEPGNYIENFRTAEFEYFVIATALTITGILLFTLLSINNKSKKVSESLIEEMNVKNLEQLEDRQKLKAYIDQIETSNKESEHREWSAIGLAKFSEILRNVHTEEQNLYDKLIQGLVKYIGANQGGLFALEKEEKSDVIILKSCYAYQRKKFIEKRIEIGEGLLGQVFFEKETIMLTDIPETYVNISSGLGESKPQCILIVPMIVNNEVQGMIELAFFTVIEQYKIDFIEKLGENIASSITAFKINARTQQLLTQSQQQTEEMRAQEEEMRQNMEELQATQEEMTRKNMEFEARIAELTQLNVQT